jgi:hypothetical protein
MLLCTLCLVPHPVNLHAISEFWRDVRQGVRMRDWPWPIQMSATQPKARQDLPEGNCPKEPMRCKVNGEAKESTLGCSAPCQGHAIACGSRLALALWGSSDGTQIYGMGH